MIDFFSASSNGQNPTLLPVIYSIILAVVLSSALAITYQKTSRKTSTNRHFIQAMVLIAIVSAMVMQAIGDSLARGLGMLGALSIIRFRNTIRDPRNIVFIFAALAIGIACGVYGFFVATIGTAIFIITTIVLYYSTLSHNNNMVGTMIIESANHELPEIEKILSEKCHRFKRTKFGILKRSQKKGEIDGEIQRAYKLYTHHYQFKLKNDLNPMELNNQVNSIEGIMIKRYDIKDTPEDI